MYFITVSIMRKILKSFSTGAEQFIGSKLNNIAGAMAHRLCLDDYSTEIAWMMAQPIVARMRAQPHCQDDGLTSLSR